MDLTQGLYVYIIIVVILILILHRWGFRLVPAFIVSLIIGQLILSLIMMPYCVEDVCSTSYCIYTVIQFTTVLIVYLYALYVALTSRRCW